MPPKPPYALPTMAEIAALPLNGYHVASTFSGCGGSSLGYRIAGFKPVWANEFVPAAQETYRANFPETPLDLRDIRSVDPADILEAADLTVGELYVLDDSPPCASFSMAGKRLRDWGEVKACSDTKQRTDDLFFEYARLVDGLRPRVFVAENVSGLVKGVAKGQFLDFLARARVLDAQWLGVPQMRASATISASSRSSRRRFPTATRSATHCRGSARPYPPQREEAKKRTATHGPPFGLRF